MPRIIKKTVGEAVADARQTKLRSQFEDLDERLKKRERFLETLKTRMQEKHPRSPVITFILNIITDIRRTLASKDEYIKRFNHFTELTAEQKKQMYDLVPITIEAALLVFDKRVVQTLDLFALINPEKGGIVKKTILEYVHGMRPETSDVDELLLTIGNPYRPHFSQTFAENKFSGTLNVATSSSDILGKPIIDVAEGIKENPLSREQINVAVFYHNGAWISMNNRSLATACSSGVEPRLEVVFPEEAFIRYYNDKVASDKLHDPFSIQLEDKSIRASRSAARSFPQVTVPLEWNTVLVTPPINEAASSSTISDPALEDISTTVTAQQLLAAHLQKQKFKEALPHKVEKGKEEENINPSQKPDGF